MNCVKTKDFSRNGINFGYLSLQFAKIRHSNNNKIVMLSNVQKWFLRVISVFFNKDELFCFSFYLDKCNSVPLVSLCSTCQREKV